jgi:hypothetical protein
VEGCDLGPQLNVSQTRKRGKNGKKKKDKGSMGEKGEKLGPPINDQIMGSLDTHPHMAAAELFRSMMLFLATGCLPRAQRSHFHISLVISRESFRFFFSSSRFE